MLTKVCLFIPLALSLCMGQGVCDEDRWEAALYAEHSALQRACAAETINSYIFEGNEKILDVGCRDGFLSALMTVCVPHGKIIGVDTSTSLIEYARKKWARYEPNLFFQKMDPEMLEYREEFDLVTVFFSFGWLANPVAAVRRFDQYLIPGGKLIILSPAKLSTELQMAVHEVIAKPEWSPFFERFIPKYKYPSMEEYMHSFTDTHFVLIKFKTHSKNVIFPSRDGFHQTLLASFVYLDAVPKELKELLLTEILDVYFTLRPLDEYGRASYSLELQEILARKTNNET